MSFLKKRLWKYRGIRITPKMEHGVLRAGLSIFIPVFILSLIIFYKNGISNVSQWFTWDYLKDLAGWNWIYIGKGLLIASLVGVTVVGFAYFIFFEKYRRIWHRQKIARMFISNRFMEKESYSTESKWSLSDKNVTKSKITYFPKAYYKIKKGYIEFRVAMDMSRFQDRFLKLGDQLENGLYCALADKELEENFVCYKLMYDVQQNRISISDVTVKNGVMKLMKHIDWKFDELPHMLIAGGTGGGKTYFILTMIEALLKSGAELRILDPKNADLADLESVMPEKTVFSRKNGIKMTLKKAREEMHDRSEKMKTMPNYKTGGNYASVGLPPLFVIFDEYVAFMEMLDHREKQEVLEDMKQLTMLGRQAGVFLILANQRPDAKYLADGIRDQFNFRVALGRNSETGYGMMFGDVDNTFVNKRIKGRGYADYGASVITEFYTPLVPKGYDFLEEIKKVTPIVESAAATTVASDSEKHSGGVSVANDDQQPPLL
ncbi:Ftsk domain-containing protein YdcQ [Lentibacillus populi]|uniref:Ftsk domain-containing protein YdcQ n=2 Tax=Lentibacillus populi TaxID=1827502 RepID=A0A9W5U2P7_9BACI|nr:Ftsk domain-containing protein YdcQ [Lentibacillus populi]